MPPARRAFASDNWAGAHPEVIEALARANGGHAPAYGYDEWTSAAEAAFRDLLGSCDVFFVFNGTGANITGLQACTRSWGAVVCPETAHINTDECGALERIAGVKILPVPTPDGKLTPTLASPRLVGFDNEHRNQPQAISITQATEMGTVYTPEEVRALAELAHRHAMRLHMDGARIANAAVSLGVPVRAFTADAGVDVLSFGATKNGILFGEAVVVFDPELAAEFKRIRKQSAQLASKNRFVAAQFSALFTDGLWLRSAAHANEMAARLAAGLRELGLELTQQVQANELFVVLPPEVADKAMAEWPFYEWDGSRHEYRLVTSWDTTEQDVDELVSLLTRLLA